MTSSKKWLAGIIIALAGFVPAWYWGNALTMLLWLICCCMAIYYIGWVSFEQERDKAKVTAGNSPEHIAQWTHNTRVFRGVWPVALLTVIYIFSLVALNSFMLPKGDNPYFFNTSYHSIYNKGVAFSRQLVLYTDDESAAAPGLWHTDKGRLQATVQNGQIVLSGNSFALPVFSKIKNEPVFSNREKTFWSAGGKQDDSVYSAINLPYKEALNNGFTLAGAAASLRVISYVEADSSSLLSPGKLRTLITGVFQCNDPAFLRTFGCAAPYTDTFRLYLGTHIRTGLSLGDLLVGTEHFQSHLANTRQLLEQWISGIAPSYLLAHYEPGQPKQLVFFPSASFLDNGYKLYNAAGAAIALSAPMQQVIAPGTRLFCGFANQQNAFYFQPDAATGNMNLLFTRPAFFALKPAGTMPHKVGEQYIRTLKNHYTGFINAASAEGYLFHEDLRAAADNEVNGHLQVLNDRPGAVLTTHVYDEQRPGDKSQTAKEFRLMSKSGQVTWLYVIRDFSQHGMGYAAVFGLLTALYLLISIVLFFFPVMEIRRIEPVLYYVIYGFIVTRCLLLWRIATFPPAEDASPSELERFINYDRLPGWGFLTSTTAWACLSFFGFIMLYRIWQGRRKKAENPEGHVPLPGYLTRFVNTPERVVWAHIIVLGICIVAGKTIAPLIAEILTRMLSIVVPVTSYLIACQWLLVVRTATPVYMQSNRFRWLNGIRKFFFYLYDSPEFLLSAATLATLMILDRGFGVLFLLFLLFKGIAVNFGRRPFTSGDKKLGALLLKPENYWIYGFISLGIYLLFLSWRGLFYYLLVYHWWAVGALLLLATGIIAVKVKERRRLWLGICGGMALLLLVFHNAGDALLQKQISNVRHRASLIYTPVDSILNRSSYNTREERKILETAESQWFINSYLDKPYDAHKTINLRPYFNQGVTYLTQTRDVVLPRFVIAELGNGVMYLLLLLLAIPVLIYFLSYQIMAKGRIGVLSPMAYSGMLSLVLLFTIGLFVWLTATNRFVFFGQDFPFLSLTSRLSVLLPLLLLLFTLLGKPLRERVSSGEWQKKWLPWALLLLIPALFIYITGRSNILKERDFTVRLAKTETLINEPVNGLLQYIQDTMVSRSRTERQPDIFKAIRYLKESADYKTWMAEGSPYTRSVLDLLTDHPARTFQLESPVFIRYDDESRRYDLSYNRNLYLALPAYEEGKDWRGDIYEANSAVAAASPGAVTIGNRIYTPAALPYMAGSGTVKMALLPETWLYKHPGNLALVNIENPANDAKASLHIFPRDGTPAIVQGARGYVREVLPGTQAYILQNGRPSELRYEQQSGKLFARNFYINGRQRLIYPLGSRFYWVHQYARAVRSAFTADSQLQQNAPVTLDFALTDTVTGIIGQTFNQEQGQKQHFRFAVIAADGDGNIRLMADFAHNRERLDPNNRKAIASLESEHFFRSSNRLERDQWGNVNLLHMAKGPGSSVKPVIAAAVASGVNAGWGELVLNNMGPLYPSVNGRREMRRYAGLDLTASPWKESHNNEFTAGVDFVKYIEESSNIYHSLIMFLGSYQKAGFGKEGHYSLANILSATGDGGRNTGPVLSFREKGYYLPSYRTGGWPRTSPGDPKSTSFGNKESLLGRGLARNFGVYVDDDNKADGSITASEKTDFGDPVMYDTLSKKQVAGFLWSFPEESSFLQAMRAFKDPARSFRDGLKNPTLGGAPYNMTPLKMAEMYGRLATQNRTYDLHISPRKPGPAAPWILDDSWTPGQYQDFLRRYIFRGMQQVLSSGTAKRMFNGNAGYRGLYCYAKTGTIGSEAPGNINSRRFELIISKNDLATADPATNKLFTIYFTADQAGDQPWDVYRRIVDAIYSSSSFRQYMQL